VLYRLANDEAERVRYASDPKAYAAAAGLAPEEEGALGALDQTRMLALGIHPLVFFLANMQIEHARKTQG
jgi:2,3-dihydroxyphenylpropionate 1,2-dioxygenase